MSLRLSKTIIVTSLAFALPASLGLAQSAPPAADTYSFSAEPSANFGSQPILVLQEGINSYLRFNLATLPSGVSVSKATLRLYVDAFAANGSFDVYQLNNSWGESTLTYKNEPSLGASATGCSSRCSDRIEPEPVRGDRHHAARPGLGQWQRGKQRSGPITAGQQWCICLRQ